MSWNGTAPSANGPAAPTFVPVNVAGAPAPSPVGNPGYGTWLPAAQPGQYGPAAMPQPGAGFAGQPMYAFGPQGQINQPPPGQPAPPGVPTWNGMAVLQPGQTMPTPPPTPEQLAQQTAAQHQAAYQENIVQDVARRFQTDPNQIRSLFADPSRVGNIIEQYVRWKNDEQAAAAQPQAGGFQPGQAQGPAAMPMQPGQAPGQFQEYPLPPNWQQLVRQDPKTGLHQPIDPAYSNIAQAANWNQHVKQSRVDLLSSDPAKFFQTDPAASKWINETVANVVNAKVQEAQTEQMVMGWKAKHHRDLVYYGPNGKPLAGPKGEPFFQPLGQAWVKHFQALTSRGMQASEELLDTSLYMAKLDLVQAGQLPPTALMPQGQQQQMGQPGAPANYPNGAAPAAPGFAPPALGYPTGPMTAAQQPPSDPVRDLLALNQGYNRWHPGGSAFTPAANEVSFEAALDQALVGVPNDWNGNDILAYLKGREFSPGGVPAAPRLF